MLVGFHVDSGLHSLLQIRLLCGFSSETLDLYMKGLQMQASIPVSNCTTLCLFLSVLQQQNTDYLHAVDKLLPLNKTVIF